MSQNDFTIANQGFPAFRADLNSALQALASNSSGTSAPSTTFANMWWYDSSNNIMYIRNEDNDAWIKFAELDQTNDKFVLSGTLQLDDGTVSAPALTFNSDTNMGIYRGGTDILKFVTAGTDAITIDASQNVGVGVSPSDKLHISGTNTGGLRLTNSNNSDAISLFVRGGNAISSTSDDTVLNVGSRSDNSIITTGNVGIGTSSPNAKLTSATTDGGSAFSIHRDFSGDVGAAETGTGSFNFTLTDTATSDQIVSRINSVAVAGTGDAFAGSMRFYTAGTNGSIAERMRVTGDGIDFRQTSGTHYVLFKNGDGIHFGATTTGASGTSVSGTVLDDYEEGTWTPSVTVGTVSSVSGEYTKIGRTVHITATLGNFSNTVNNEKLLITSLPFTASVTARAIGGAMWSDINKDFGSEITFIDSSSRLAFYHSDDGSFEYLRHIHLDGSSSTVYLYATYFAS